MRYDNIVDRKLLRNIDIGIVVTAIILIIIGIVGIASATQVTSGGTPKYITIQGVAFVLGIIAVLLLLLIDYNSFGDMQTAIYIINVLLLLSVFVLGKEVKGAKSWIDLGPINFQPSELVKIGFILAFAKHLETRKDKLNSIKNVAISVLYIIVPIALIQLQNDTGTMLVFMFISAMMFFAAGINYKYIIGAVGAFILSAPLLWFFALQEYQKKRILVFLNPELDPRGSGYHVIQSKTAIGSGQFFGEGLFNGTLNNNGFIPERHTDFIFSVLGEELGFVGAVFVVILFTILLLRCVYVAKAAKDTYGMLICVGVTAMYLFHVLENIGMTIGIMPVTGIPLPFVSYGGSSLLTNMLALGLIINVGMRRQVIRF
ncbi:MAG: rod shape-determining protein RodA [Clostridiales bacterium GWB2_37_7]|nr:MAG: rod shape-determining protein RodA [Clostridiales bacterium GWB2_37_7]